MLSLNYVDLDAQETKDFLFIGASFISYYSMPAKFERNFEQANGIQAKVDSSLYYGYGFYHQIQTNEELHQMLKTTNYKCIIIESYLLLAPENLTRMSNAIKLLVELAPSTEKIILVPLETCYIHFPRYECVRVVNDVECNIYQDCQAIIDTLNAVSKQLILEFEDLEVLPLFHLKREIKVLDFPQFDDPSGHPTDEFQEILARFLVFWLADSKEKYQEKFAEIWLHDNYKTVTKEMMDIILQHYITLSKFKTYD
jgi:hypothetical protein